MANIPAAQHQGLFEKILGYVKLAGNVAGIIPDSHAQTISRVIEVLSRDLESNGAPSKTVALTIAPDNGVGFSNAPVVADPVTLGTGVYKEPVVPKKKKPAPRGKRKAGK